MGKSKELFMQDREAEMFIEQIQQVEDGYISPLDMAVKFKKEIEQLTEQIDVRKAWLDENLMQIEQESAKYNNEYKGYKITLQTRETASYKHIPEWVKVEKAKKEIEEKSKMAYKMVQKGGLNVDENGVEIPLPEYKRTSFLKFDKLK